MARLLPLIFHLLILAPIVLSDVEEASAVLRALPAGEEASAVNAGGEGVSTFPTALRDGEEASAQVLEAGGVGREHFRGIDLVSQVRRGGRKESRLAVDVSHRSKAIERIAFGSCRNQSAQQPIWESINRFDPDLFIFLGDNIYADDELPYSFWGANRTIGPFKNTEKFVQNSPDEMKRRYDIQKRVPGYEILRRKAKIIGTWDDHDFGYNDAGKELTTKNISQKLLLDFLDEDEHSLRRQQAGVYTSYVFGPSNRSVKVILLDTRYFRDPLDSDGSLLGKSQWLWLRRELGEQPTNITIIGSSIQVISNISAFTAPVLLFEGWGRFPKERKRLFRLISMSKRPGVFFISGDVHYAEICRMDCATSYPLLDFTSSGLTQSAEKEVSERLAFAFRLLMLFLHGPMRVYNSRCYYASCVYGKPNFGAIEINWTVPANFKVQMRSIKNEPVLEATILLSDLGFRKVVKSKFSSRYCRLEIEQLVSGKLQMAALYITFIGCFLMPFGTCIWMTIRIRRARASSNARLVRVRNFVREENTMNKDD